MAFPSLVGGFSLRRFDLAPSIIFCSLYGLLIPFFIYRLCCKRSRTSVFSGTMSFTVERTIMLSLRAAVATERASDQSSGLMEYMQSTLALGFLAIILDVSALLRCVLVNSTRPSDDGGALEPKHKSPELITEHKLWKATYNSEVSLFTEKTPAPSVAETLAEQCLDQPNNRFWFRRISDAMVALYFAALVTGIVGNALLIAQHSDAKKNNVNQALRYVSSSIALLIALAVCGVATWAGRNLPRVDRRAASYIVIFSLLLAIPGAYRLSVMYRTTTDYASSDPGSYNSAGAKAAFYTLHVLPEWIVSLMLGVLNVRQTFGTGSHGDSKWRDETPEEKEKREKKEEKKREPRLPNMYSTA